MVLASVGTALLAAAGGLSMAAGAFLAGLILAEGESARVTRVAVPPDAEFSRQFETAFAKARSGEGHPRADGPRGPTIGM